MQHHCRIFSRGFIRVASLAKDEILRIYINIDKKKIGKVILLQIESIL